MELNRSPERRIRPSTLAIGALAVGVGLYDYLCPEGEQISERCDEWVEHPIKRAALYTSLGAIGLHLVNKLDERVDVLHMLGSFKRGASRAISD